MAVNPVSLISISKGSMIADVGVRTLMIAIKVPMLSWTTGGADNVTLAPIDENNYIATFNLLKL